MTAEIKGGYVLYGKTANRGDYNSEKAEAQFTFSADNADEARDISATAVAMAMTKVEEMLSGKTAAPAAEKPKKTEKPKKDKPAKEDPEPEIRKNPEDRKDPTDVEETATAETDVDGIDSFDPDPSEVEVTDKALLDACNKKASSLKSALGADASKAVRKVVAKYVSAPKGVADMPKELRQKFLEELEALKP